MQPILSGTWFDASSLLEKTDYASVPVGSAFINPSDELAIHYFTEREKEREKKMILHLLLLISPAFGMPSNALLDAGEEIINQLDSLVDFNEETKSIFGHFNFEEISDSLSEAEEKRRKYKKNGDRTEKFRVPWIN